MKKIIGIFVCILITVSGVFTFLGGFNEFGSTDKSMYLVSMNENNVFDSTFNAQCHMQFTMPHYSPALPIQSIEQLQNLDSVKKVYPFYSLFIYGQFNEENVALSYWQESEIKKTLMMPLERAAMQGATEYIREFRIKPVVDYELFYNAYPNSNFVKKFETDSGVYISDSLFEFLELDSTAKKLYIQLPIQVPVIAEMKNVDYEFNDGFSFSTNEYTVTEHQLVEYTVEVEAVIDTSYGKKFSRGIDMIFPYELTEEIVNSINLDRYELSDNQMYWEPNCYVVVCEEETNVNQLGQLIDQEIGSCFIYHYDHGLEIDPLHYLFKDGETLVK